MNPVLYLHVESNKNKGGGGFGSGYLNRTTPEKKRSDPLSYDTSTPAIISGVFSRDVIFILHLSLR